MAALTEIADPAEAQLEELTGVRPRAVAVDRHPSYRSRRWGLDHAEGRTVHGVQHHHAHVAATMAEHGIETGRRVLGFAFDGTGYGDDGAVWGGEVLVADYAGFARAAHLSYVPLPGGDAGVGNPCRMALSHLRSAGTAWAADLPCVRACRDDEVRLLERQLDTGFGCVPTSSMGRLFDAVASIAGICHRAEYDAQAAMELEAVARRAPEQPGYEFRVVAAADPVAVDAGPVVTAAAADTLAGVDAAVVASRFQHAVVDMVGTVAALLRRRTGIETVTLSGGVFLNAFLTSRCAQALAANGFEVLRHERVPASDAGIALGQVAVLAHVLAQPSTTPPRRFTPPDKEPPCA